MKLLVSEIIEFIHGIGPMYNSPDFVELLTLNDTGKFTTVFKSILKRALGDYELKYPLLMWDRNIYVQNEKYSFIDNYDAFLEGKITEEYLELIPTSVVHYTNGLLKAYRDFTYIRPLLKIGKNGKTKVSYFTKYPLKLTIDKHEDKFTEDSHIYGIDMEAGPPLTYLMYQIEYYLLIYLRDQKAQLAYTDLPIDFMSNLETRLSEVQTDIQDWYQNPIWYAKLFI